MKIFAIQKTPTNTYSPKYQQNNSVNQNSAIKTNIAGDKFVSNKVPFGASVNQLEAKLAKLDEQLRLKQLTEEAYEKLARPIREEMESLKAFLHIDEEPYDEMDELWHRTGN
jgi:hypothetical protein